MQSPAGSSLRRDVLSAYILTASRVISWVIVSGVVYRSLGRDAFGLVTMIRATVGLFAYTSLGVGPAMVRKLAEALRTPAVPIPAQPLEEKTSSAPPMVLHYGGPRVIPDDRVHAIYTTGEWTATCLGIAGAVLLTAYALVLGALHDIPDRLLDAARQFVGAFGFGVMLRVVSEAPSALLQVRSRIAFDNYLVATAELLWALATVLIYLTVGFYSPTPSLMGIGLLYTASNGLLLLARGIAGRLEARHLVIESHGPNIKIAAQLLTFGVLVVLAQAADFLYAPTDYILINRLIGSAQVATYAPAVQIDSALLLAITAAAAVLFPRAAIAHVAGDIQALRRYYLRGTLLSATLLALLGGILYAFSPVVFRLWLSDPMAATQSILPLVLIHTIVGGSSAIGRSVLLGMGKVRAFTAAVIIAGIANVILSYSFVRFLHLGLRGIIYGTIVVVVARCAIWMPWYVLRSLEQPTVHNAPGSALDPREIV